MLMDALRLALVEIGYSCTKVNKMPMAHFIVETQGSRANIVIYGSAIDPDSTEVSIHSAWDGQISPAVIRFDLASPNSIQRIHELVASRFRDGCY